MDGDGVERSETNVEVGEAFCEEFLTSERRKGGKRGREFEDGREGRGKIEALNVRKTRAVKLEETLELKQLHLEMLRERRCSKTFGRGGKDD